MVQKEATKWFKNLHSGRASIEDVKRAFKTKSPRLSPGEMFTYAYDPKTKDRLPVYDAFPLIIFLERAPGGWYGLNLHYLPPAAREGILKAMLDKKYSMARIARALSNDPSMNVCLKRYLASHVVGKAIGIKKSDWLNAVNLPYEKMVTKRKR